MRHLKLANALVFLLATFGFLFHQRVVAYDYSTTCQVDYTLTYINSTIINLGLQPAGKWSYFLVQLYDIYGDPSSCDLDPLLQVTCTSAEASNGQTFCDPGLVVKSLGHGLYNVTYIVGRIWGACAVWPPRYSTMGSLPSSYFQGTNKINVKYNGHHIPGSPVLMNTLQPSTQLSTYNSIVTLSRLTTMMAGVQTSFLYFYAIMDSYTNWIRDSSIQNLIHAYAFPQSYGNCDDDTISFPSTAATTSSCIAAAEAVSTYSVYTGSWFQSNWWLYYVFQFQIAGQYALMVTYDPYYNTSATPYWNQSSQPLIIYATSSYTRSLTFTVLPATLTLSQFVCYIESSNLNNDWSFFSSSYNKLGSWTTYSVSEISSGSKTLPILRCTAGFGSNATTNSTTNVCGFWIQAQDVYNNYAWLVDPSSYSSDVSYTVAMQNASLLQATSTCRQYSPLSGANGSFSSFSTNNTLPVSIVLDLTRKGRLFFRYTPYVAESCTIAVSYKGRTDANATVLFNLSVVVEPSVADPEKSFFWISDSDANTNNSSDNNGSVLLYSDNSLYNSCGNTVTNNKSSNGNYSYSSVLSTPCTASVAYNGSGTNNTQWICRAEQKYAGQDLTVFLVLYDRYLNPVTSLNGIVVMVLYWSYEITTATYELTEGSLPYTGKVNISVYPPEDVALLQSPSPPLASPSRPPSSPSPPPPSPSPPPPSSLPPLSSSPRHPPPPPPSPPPPSPPPSATPLILQGFKFSAPTQLYARQYALLASYLDWLIPMKNPATPDPSSVSQTYSSSNLPPTPYPLSSPYYSPPPFPPPPPSSPPSSVSKQIQNPLWACVSYTNAPDPSAKASSTNGFDTRLISGLDFGSGNSNSSPLSDWGAGLAGSEIDFAMARPVVAGSANVIQLSLMDAYSNPYLVGNPNLSLSVDRYSDLALMNVPSASPSLLLSLQSLLSNSTKSLTNVSTILSSPTEWINPLRCVAFEALQSILLSTDNASNSTTSTNTSSYSSVIAKLKSFMPYTPTNATSAGDFCTTSLNHHYYQYNFTYIPYFSGIYLVSVKSNPNFNSSSFLEYTGTEQETVLLRRWLVVDPDSSSNPLVYGSMNSTAILAGQALDYYLDLYDEYGNLHYLSYSLLNISDIQSQALAATTAAAAQVNKTVSISNSSALSTANQLLLTMASIERFCTRSSSRTSITSIASVASLSYTSSAIPPASSFNSSAQLSYFYSISRNVLSNQTEALKTAAAAYLLLYILKEDTSSSSVGNYANHADISTASDKGTQTSNVSNTANVQSRRRSLSNSIFKAGDNTLSLDPLEDLSNIFDQLVESEKIRTPKRLLNEDTEGEELTTQTTTSISYVVADSSSCCGIAALGSSIRMSIVPYTSGRYVFKTYFRNGLLTKIYLTVGSSSPSLQQSIFFLVRHGDLASVIVSNWDSTASNSSTLQYVLIGGLLSFQVQLQDLYGNGISFTDAYSYNTASSNSNATASSPTSASMSYESMMLAGTSNAEMPCQILSYNLSSDAKTLKLYAQFYAAGNVTIILGSFWNSSAASWPYNNTNISTNNIDSATNFIAVSYWTANVSVLVPSALSSATTNAGNVEAAAALAAAELAESKRNNTTSNSTSSTDHAWNVAVYVLAGVGTAAVLVLSVYCAALWLDVRHARQEIEDLNCQLFEQQRREELVSQKPPLLSRSWTLEEREKNFSTIF